jgi:hypothetical protein
VKAALSALRYALDEARAVPPASNHIPASARRMETIEEAELLFRAYAESFMQDYEVEACK